MLTAAHSVMQLKSLRDKGRYELARHPSVGATGQAGQSAETAAEMTLSRIASIQCQTLDRLEGGWEVIKGDEDNRLRDTPLTWRLTVADRAGGVRT